MKQLFALLLCALMSHALPALAVYKCSRAGVISYSDTSCPTGTQIALDIPSTDASNAAETTQKHQEAQRQLKQLESARHKREAQQAREAQHAARAHAAKEKKCATLARRKRWADEDAASAKGKSTEKAKRKARRLEEQFQADCAG